MSAFIVSPEHISAMLRSGLQRGDGRYWSPLRWMAPVPAEERELTLATDFERGAMMGGPSSLDTYQRRQRELTDETCNEVGRMLMLECARSVSFRYNEPIDAGTLPGPIDLNPYAETFHAKDVMRGIRYSAVQILKAIDCYEYQSCEHPDWETSEAKVFCDALRGLMIGRLDGYADAQWEIQ